MRLAERGDRRRAEPHARPHSRSRESLPRSRSPRSRDPPDVSDQVEERERCAQALSRARSRAAAVRARTSSSFRVEDRRRSARRCCASGLVVRVFADGIRCVDPRPRGRRPPARGACACARSVTAPSATRRAATRSAPPRDRRDAIPRSARPRRLGPRSRSDGRRDSTTTSSSSSPSTPASTSSLEGVGDLETGPHHTAEDAALALGEALDRALGDRRGIARYGDAVVPMDDALARAAVDLGGRPASEIRSSSTPGSREHVLRSLAQAGRLAINVEATGRDEHHVAEAAFKAVGRVATSGGSARGRRAARRRRAACERRGLRVRRRERALGRRRLPAPRRRRQATSEPDDVATADLAVLPGVGSAASAMAACGHAVSTSRFASGLPRAAPTLGICLGLQLALDESEEDGGVAGLGLLPGRAVRIRDGPGAAHRLGARRAGR